MRMSNIILSIIVPIKVSYQNEFLIKRAHILLKQFANNKNIELIFVDSSVNRIYSNNLKNLCNKYNSIYCYYKIRGVYSAAIARSYGAKRADANYLLFYDVDLIVASNFLTKILEDIKQLHPLGFTIYPCLYLTESQTKKIENKHLEDTSFTAIKEKYLQGYNDEVLYLAVNTSTILVNKEHFFNIGGYDENYKGHGYEDFDLIHKLYMAYPIIQRETDYPIDFKTNFPASYKGFRKYYAYYALENFFRGMFTMHLYHPRPLTKSYYRKRSDNAKYFLKKLEESLSIPLEHQYINNTLSKNFKKYIDDLLLKYGYDPNIYFGLTKLNDKATSVVQANFFKRKLRKLLMHPILFFIDMKKNNF